MRINKSADIFLNVAAPVSLGYFIYLMGTVIEISSIIKQYVPDGLWAYSFVSAILIVWERRLNYFWLVMIFLLAACFELFQHLQLIGGTGDKFDVLVYFSFFGIALTLNKTFKNAKPLAPFNF